MLSHLFFEEPNAPQKKRKLDVPQKKATRRRKLQEAEQEESAQDSVHESDIAHWRRHSAEPSSKSVAVAITFATKLSSIVNTHG